MARPPPRRAGGRPVAGKPSATGGLGLLLALAAALLAGAQAALLPTPRSLQYHRVHTLPGPDPPPAGAPDHARDIRFCDFFSQDTLLPGATDGLDDLAFYQTYYAMRPGQESHSRQRPQPVHFLPGSTGSLHCTTATAFPRAGLTYPATRYDPATGPTREVFFDETAGLVLRGNGHFATAYALGPALPPVLAATFPDGRDAPLSGLVSFDHGTGGTSPWTVRIEVLGSDNTLLRPYMGSVSHLRDIRQAAAVDLDADGLPEVLLAAKDTTTPGCEEDFCLLLLEGLLQPDLPAGALFHQRHLLRLPGSMAPGPMLLGDFDGDGHASDVAILPAVGSTTARPQLVLLLSGRDFARRPVHIDLAGAFYPSPPAAWSEAVIKGAAGRLDPGHQHHTLVLAAGRRVLALAGPLAFGPDDHSLDLASLPHWALVPDLDQGFWVAIALGDADGDARPDLALAHSHRPTDIRLYSAIEATPACWCGPTHGLCVHAAGPHDSPTCSCRGANRRLTGTYAPCEACAPGHFAPGDDDCIPACEIAHCRHCLEGRCLACERGLLLAEDGRTCGHSCADPDATVVEGRCSAPAPAFVPWMVTTADPSWGDFQPVGFTHARMAPAPAGGGDNPDHRWPVATVEPSLVGYFPSDPDTLTLVPVGQSAEVQHLSVPGMLDEFIVGDRTAAGAAAPTTTAGGPAGAMSAAGPASAIGQLLAPRDPVHLGALLRAADRPPGGGPAGHPARRPAVSLATMAGAATALAHFRPATGTLPGHAFGYMVAPSALTRPLPVTSTLTMLLFGSSMAGPGPALRDPLRWMVDVPLPFPAGELALAPAPAHGQTFPQLASLVRTTTGEHLLAMPGAMIGYWDLQWGLAGVLLSLPSVSPRLSIPRLGHRPGEAVGLALPAVAELYPRLAGRPADRPGALFINMAAQSPDFLYVQPPGDDVPLHQALYYQRAEGAPAQGILVRADALPAGIVAQPYDCLWDQSLWDLDRATGEEPYKTPAGLLAEPFLPGNRSGRRDSGCPLAVIEHHAVSPTAELVAMDTNRDGQEDLVLLDRATGRVVFYLAQPGVEGVAFRRVVVLPGFPPAGRPAAGSPAARPSMHLLDVNHDGRLDVVLLDGPDGAGSPARGPRIRVFAHPDAEAPRCPAGTHLDAASLTCVCPGGEAVHFDTAAGRCACVAHADPGPDGRCACPAGLVAAAGQCACPAGTRPVFDEATLAEVLPRECAPCDASCATCSAGPARACGTCPPGRLLVLAPGPSACVSACPAGMNPTSAGGACVACGPGCDACTTADRCTACAPGFYLSAEDHQCHACDVSCGACSGPGALACRGCAAGFLLEPATGRCWSDCPDGTGPDLVTGQCQPCGNAACRRCVSPAAGAHCSACPAGFTLGSSPRECVPCGPGCLACYTAEFPTCLACQQGTVLHEQKCLPACPDGMYAVAAPPPAQPGLPASAVCRPCHSTCAQCTGPLASQCTACVDPLAELASGQDPACRSVCPDAGSQPAALAACPCSASGCLSCQSTGPYVCARCIVGYLMTADGQCIRQGQCPPLTYADMLARSCYPCGVFCSSCHPGRPEYCLTCSSRDGFLPLPGGYCSRTCPEVGYFVDNLDRGRCKACPANCWTCARSTGCDMCHAGFFMHQGACLAACPEGTFPSAGGCHACDRQCATCTGPGPGQCATCPAGAVLSAGGRCLAGGRCPAGSADYLTPGVCAACAGGCAACTGPAPDQCTACMYGMLPDPRAAGACLAACPDGWFPDPAASLCAPCHRKCATCAGPGGDSCLAPAPGAGRRTALAIGLGVGLPLLVVLVAAVVAAILLLRRKASSPEPAKQDAVEMAPVPA
ncbi:hypothetical protein H696_05445 [Fonticula alba]|uniref:Laminin EGF-like domain-containing protein n=1 Tax=Fonticula alba TaxID=691883 RepID=A0A058Z255_FONAL|nr:hypothetical protein H696_05445 [Fonticula alba]KCV67983.1 hypothetical protein H696_05445 [Fonticula alba]|eukprot:XP_009497550.1 hypothetical protein H696_05445 [Fonticula alba]